jgi:hypothetical protein
MTIPNVKVFSPISIFVFLTMTEPLDFCRVKKIDEKGFGFLKSLYYPGDVFFHFSQIKKEEFVEKLNHMKRGDFFLFFTSKPRNDGKRKVQQVWYNLVDVPTDYIGDFAERVAQEFVSGWVNLYDLFFVFAEIRKLQGMKSELVSQILLSPRILKLPATILPYINEAEKEELKRNLNFDSLKDIEPKPFWYQDFLPKQS